MTRQHTAWISLFLCICCLSRQYSHAARLLQSNLRQDALMNNHLIDKVTAAATDSVKELKPKGHQDRHKRVAVHTVLLATTIAVGYSSIGFEAYLAIEGCCGLYKEACENNDKFEKLKPVVENKGVQVDSEYLAASNVLEYVKQCNYLNQEIWIQLKTIGELSEELITTIDGSLIAKFQEKQDEIEKQVIAKNQTIIDITYEQLDTEFDSMFDSTLGRLQLLAKAFGFPVYFAAEYAYKQYKINQIEKTLTTSYGKQLTNAQPNIKKFFGINEGAVKKHLHDTAASQYKSRLANSKMTFYMNGATNVYYTFAIGFEIYNTIKKVEDCRKTRDKSRTALASAVEADKQLDDLLKNVTDYRKFVDKEGWIYVKEQVTGDQVTAILEDLSELAEDSSETAQTQDLENASKTIKHFISTIPSADYSKTFSLQKKLISALDLMTVTIGCQTELAKLLRFVTSGCKGGLDTLHNLYKAGVTQYQKVNSDTCRVKANVPYTNETDVSDLLRAEAAEQGFQFDCVLNDIKLKSPACNYYFLGYTATQIASKMGLTESQVKFFIKDCPPPTSLTSQQMNFVCQLRKAGKSDAEIVKAIGLPELQPLVAAYTCPTESPQVALSQADQERVCTFRGFGIPDEDIAKIIDCDLALVKIVVCPLTTEQKKKVCDFRGYGMQDSDIASALKYDLTLVKAVKCA